MLGLNVQPHQFANLDVALTSVVEAPPVTDADLIGALDELQHDRETLTRSLLGSADPTP